MKLHLCHKNAIEENKVIWVKLVHLDLSHSLEPPEASLKGQIRNSPLLFYHLCGRPVLAHLLISDHFPAPSQGQNHFLGYGGSHCLCPHQSQVFSSRHTKRKKFFFKKKVFILKKNEYKLQKMQFKLWAVSALGGTWDIRMELAANCRIICRQGQCVSDVGHVIGLKKRNKLQCNLLSGSVH